MIRSLLKAIRSWHWLFFAVVANVAIAAQSEQGAISNASVQNASVQDASERATAERVLPLGLPKWPQGVSWPSDQEIALGRQLFFERRLSFNDTLSCAMCHLEENAFASNQTARSVGMEGKSLQRNAPSLLNVVYQDLLFHDGHEQRLDWQVWLPLLSPIEMANPSIGVVMSRLKGTNGYVEAFERVYPDEGLTPNTLGKAIAAFERSLVSGSSRFDRYYFGDEKNALNEREIAGLKLFTGKAGCSVCHTLDAESALFSDLEFHNTGIGYKAMFSTPESYTVELAQGVSISVPSREVEEYSDPPINDIGRFAVTHDPDDRWSYKTPTLRDVSKTAPYMHDGSLSTLKDVVEYYNGGGYPAEGLSSRIKPLGLQGSEVEALVLFLKTLEGEVGWLGQKIVPQQ